MTFSVKEPSARAENSPRNDQGAGQLSPNHPSQAGGQPVDLEAMGQAARQASRKLAGLTSTQKNDALHAIADALEARSAEVLAQNELDIAGGRANGLSDALLDRLLLTPERIRGLADDTRRSRRCPTRLAPNWKAACCPTVCALADDAFRSASWASSTRPAPTPPSISPSSA